MSHDCCGVAAEGHGASADQTGEQLGTGLGEEAVCVLAGGPQALLAAPAATPVLRAQREMPSFIIDSFLLFSHEGRCPVLTVLGFCFDTFRAENRKKGTRSGRKAHPGALKGGFEPPFCA